MFFFSVKLFLSNFLNCLRNNICKFLFNAVDFVKVLTYGWFGHSGTGLKYQLERIILI